MDGKTLARIAAIVFVAIAITAAVIDATRKKPAAVDTSVSTAVAPTDPLITELNHCQLIGEAGARDSDCLRAWAENRRRFLAPGARPEAKLPDPPQPTAPNETEAR